MHVSDTVLSRGLREPLCEGQLLGSGEREAAQLFSANASVHMAQRESIMGVRPLFTDTCFCCCLVAHFSDIRRIYYCAGASFCLFVPYYVVDYLVVVLFRVVIK